MTKISSIIVNWNSGSYLRDCLNSIVETTHGQDVEIIVIDNGSRDESLVDSWNEFPQAKILLNAENIGFAAGTNVGIKAASGKFLLLLNPDIIAKSGAINTLASFLATHPEVGAVAGKLLSPDGTPQIGFNVRSFPTLATVIYEALLLNALLPQNRVNRQYRMLDWSHDEVREVDQPAAACLMLKREVIQNVGLLDEQFFPAWFEDVDYCKRIKDAGWKIYFHPEAEFVHRGGLSLERLSYHDFLVAFYRNLLRYLRKHHRFPSPLLRVLIAIGMVARLAAIPFFPTLLKAPRGEALRAYLGVIRVCLVG
jgi:GT2 family glycosyltransferase